MSRKRVLGVSTEKNIGKSANKAHRDLITFNSEFAKNESENEEEDNMNGDEHTSSHLYRLQSSQLSIAEPGGVFSSMRLRTQTNGSPTQTTHQTQHVHAQVKNTGKIVGNFSGNGNGNGNGKSVGKGKGKDKGALASTISSTHLTDNHRIVDISTVPPTLPFYTTDPTTTDYCIQRPIGAGGFAIVYKVIQMNRLTGTPVLLIPPSPTATSFSSSTSALSSSPCSVRRHIPASSITTSKSANNEHHLGFAMKSFHFMKAGDIVEVKVRVQSATQAYAQARAREDAHEMYAANTAITSSSNSSSSSNNKASRALMLRLTDIDNHPDYFTFQWKAGRISHVNKKGKYTHTYIHTYEVDGWQLDVI